MNPTPPLGTRQPAPFAAQTIPAVPKPPVSPTPPAPAPEAGALDVAHACPHCGHPLAVITVLVPVEDPAGLGEPAGGVG